MGNAITPECRAVWLTLARLGGWWTVKTIVRHFRPTFAEFEVIDIVQALQPGGYLVGRAMVPGGQLSYAVTSECNPLPGRDPRRDGTVRRGIPLSEVKL